MTLKKILTFKKIIEYAPYAEKQDFIEQSRPGPCPCESYRLMRKTDIK